MASAPLRYSRGMATTHPPDIESTNDQPPDELLPVWTPRSSLPELQEAAIARGLETTGTRAEIIEKLEAHELDVLKEAATEGGEYEGDDDDANDGTVDDNLDEPEADDGSDESNDAVDDKVASMREAIEAYEDPDDRAARIREVVQFLLMMIRVYCPESVMREHATSQISLAAGRCANMVAEN